MFAVQYCIYRDREIQVAGHPCTSDPCCLRVHYSNVPYFKSVVLDVISSTKYFHKDTQISVWLNDWGVEPCQFGAENWLTCRKIYFQWLGGIGRYPYYKYLKTLYVFMNVYRKTFLWSLYQESMGISNKSGSQKDAGDNGVGHGSGMSSWRPRITWETENTTDCINEEASKECVFGQSWILWKLTNFVWMFTVQSETAHLRMLQHAGIWDFWPVFLL